MGFACGTVYRKVLKPTFNKILLNERTDICNNRIKKILFNIDFRLMSMFLGAEPEDYFFMNFIKRVGNSVIYL